MNKLLTLDTLQVQVVAIPENVDIKIAIPLEFITIEQTSGCMLTRNKKRRS